MRRRDFIAGLSATAAWPLAARAQQRDQKRRVGILWPLAQDDPFGKVLYAAFLQALAELGWTESKLHIDVRWGPVTAEQAHVFAKELIAQRPDVLTTGTVLLTRVLQQETKTIPIVMHGAGDPLAMGLVRSLARPEGNTTGVTEIFTSLSGKWLEMLREAKPSLARVGLIFDVEKVETGAGKHPFEEGAEQAGAQYGIKTMRMPVRDADEIARTVTAFADEPNGGLIVLPPPLLASERQVLNRLAVQYRLPVCYQERAFVVEGGLLSYGADILDLFRRHGGPDYVDRILRGAKPGDLPIQFPTRFQLVVNLKTAKAMGLRLSESFLIQANEVIE